MSEPALPSMQFLLPHGISAAHGVPATPIELLLPHGMLPLVLASMWLVHLRVLAYGGGGGHARLID